MHSLAYRTFRNPENQFRILLSQEKGSQTQQSQQKNLTTVQDCSSGKVSVAASRGPVSALLGNEQQNLLRGRSGRADASVCTLHLQLLPGLSRLPQISWASTYVCLFPFSSPVW